MWRVLSVVEDMSASLINAAQYLGEALEAIDHEMTTLQERLHADAQHLRDGIASADLSDTDRDSLLTTLARIELTAESVATFAHGRQPGTPR